MATKFSPNITIEYAKQYPKEALVVTASIFSGSYGEPAIATSNIKDHSLGYYQTTYDYPHLSQSASPLCDITYGVRSGGAFTTTAGTTADPHAKENIYNQMSALILGYNQTGSLRVFDLSGSFDTVASSVMDSPTFFNFSRLVMKDEIKAGSFELVLDEDTWNQGMHFSGSLITITDADSTNLENGLRILKTSAGNNVGILDRFRGIAAIQLSSSLVSTVFDNEDIDFFVSASDARSWDYEESIENATILELATATRHRIQRLSLTNTTQLNNAIYYITAQGAEFNYSSNPSYVNTSSQIRVCLSAGTPDNGKVAYSYVTGIGLYASDGELMAVAKISKPVKKQHGFPFSIGVRLTV